MRRFGICDSNLLICVTSRLESDVNDILDPLIFRFVSLAAHAFESAATLAQLTLIEWQANRRPIPDNPTTRWPVLPRAGSPSEDQVSQKVVERSGIDAFPLLHRTRLHRQVFYAERAVSSACECGFSPQMVNHVVFDRSRYDTVRSANSRFDFDDRAGLPIERLHGVLQIQSAIRTRALLRF